MLKGGHLPSNEFDINPISGVELVPMGSLQTWQRGGLFLLVKRHDYGNAQCQKRDIDKVEL